MSEVHAYEWDVSSSDSDDSIYLIDQSSTEFRTKTDIRLREPIYAADKLNERFQLLVNKWKEESQYLSSTTRSASLPSYRGIIEMGKPAIPYLLRELRGEPNHWFKALVAIVGYNPVKEEDRGNVQEMTAAWLKWGEEVPY